MKLLLLRCPRCNQALSPGQEDEVIQCPSCRSAVALNPQRVAIQEVQYAAPRTHAGVVTDWVPLWVFHGQVELRERLTQAGSSRLEEAQAMWGEPRNLYIPAWQLPLHEAADMAQEMVERQPTFRPVDPPVEALFHPVVVGYEDARKLIGLVVVTIEAERKDYLQALDFDLRVDAQTLWLLPARPRNDTWEILT